MSDAAGELVVGEDGELYRVRLVRDETVARADFAAARAADFKTVDRLLGGAWVGVQETLVRAGLPEKESGRVRLLLARARIRSMQPTRGDGTDVSDLTRVLPDVIEALGIILEHEREACRAARAFDASVAQTRDGGAA